MAERSAWKQVVEKCVTARWIASSLPSRPLRPVSQARACVERGATTIDTNMHSPSAHDTRGKQAGHLASGGKENSWRGRMRDAVRACGTDDPHEGLLRRRGVTTQMTQGGRPDLGTHQPYRAPASFFAQHSPARPVTKIP